MKTPKEARRQRWCRTSIGIYGKIHRSYVCSGSVHRVPVVDQTRRTYQSVRPYLRTAFCAWPADRKQPANRVLLPYQGFRGWPDILQKCGDFQHGNAQWLQVVDMPLTANVRTNTLGFPENIHKATTVSCTSISSPTSTLFLSTSTS